MKYTFGAEDLEAYVQPASDDEDAVRRAFRDQLNWDTSGEYDGWQRAGAEAWMRHGYQDGEPVVVEKSGNAYATLTRGATLDQAGAHIVPTIMFAPDDAVDQGKGFDYTMFQQYMEDGAADHPVLDTDEAISFRDRYNHVDDLSDRAIDQFAENCAAIDSLGYKPVSGESLIRDFLTEGDECYMVDFGWDLGSPDEAVAAHDYNVLDLSPEELAIMQQDTMREAGREFLDADDRDRFDAAYADARRDFLSSFATGAELDDLLAAQDMSSRERHYRKQQI